MSRNFLTRAASALGLLLLASPVAPALAQESESESEGTVSSQAVNANVNGSGATFAQNIQQAWTADFKKREPQATVSYSAVGSTAGRRNFCDGVTDYGASDTPFPKKADEDACAKQRPFVYLPITAGGIAAFYNLPGSPKVNLSGSTLAKIFSGKIVQWDDPAIKAENGGNAPSTMAIEVVVRSDGSGTTNVFTDYMKQAGSGNWSTGNVDVFPQAADIPGKNASYKQTRASGSSNVTAEVKKTAGRIGYAEVSFAKNSGLPSSSIRNEGGAFVQPTGAAVSEAIGDGNVKADNTVDINFLTANPAAYPISTVSYVLAPTIINNRDKADTLKAYLVYSNGIGQDLADPNDYAPIPKKLRDNNTIQLNKINASSSSSSASPTQTTTLQTGTVDGGTAAAAPATATTAAPAAAPVTTVAPVPTTPTTVRATVASASASRSTTAAPAMPGAVAATGGEHVLVALAGSFLLLFGFLGQRRLRATS